METMRDAKATKDKFLGRFFIVEFCCINMNTCYYSILLQSSF